MVQKLLNASVAQAEKPNIVGIVPGQEKFAFLYVVIAAPVIACVMIYSAVAGLAWWQTLLLLIGGLIGAWGTVFSFLEVNRLNRSTKNIADEAHADANRYSSRIVVVEPATGDPCPHHENYPESAGFDQGQLTSRLPDSMPFIDRFLNRRRNS
jgi:hypothetical protein